MAKAVEASASTARPRKLKKGQRRVKQQQQEGTEPNKGTVRERKRARLPKNEHLRDLGAPSPATVPTYRIRAQTQGEEHKEKTGEQKDPATMDASRTTKLTVGLGSAREEEERKNV